MRAAIYVRLSRETEETTSPARQRQSCERLIVGREWDYDPEHDLFEDIDVSAYSGQRRPAWRRLTRQLDAYDAVVFWRLDRVARSTVEFGHILELLAKHGTKLVSATEPFDTSTPIGEAMAWIVMVFAQLESRTIALRVRDAQEHLVAHGRRRGGRRPFGWLIGDNGLVLHPTEAPELRQVVADVLSGVTVSELTRRLNTAGVRTSMGNEWDRSVLLDLLRNPLLTGQVTYRGEVVVDDAGEAVIVNEPLVDDWTWRRLQTELDSRRTTRRRSDEHLLSGICRCVECGWPMWGSPTTYSCRRALRAGRGACPGNQIKRGYVEDYAIGWMAGRLSQPGFLEDHRRAAAKRHSGPDPVVVRTRQLRASLDRLEADRLDGLFDDPDGRRRYVERHRGLTTELAALAEQAPPVASQDLDELLVGIEPTPEGLEAAPRAVLRSIAKLLIERIDVRKGNTRTGGKRDTGRFEIIPR